MAFSRSGTTITQSGTDTNLSGLSGIAGVTTYDELYVLNGLRLEITGNLSFNALTERLIINNYNSVAAGASGYRGAVTIRSGATWTNTARRNDGRILDLPVVQVSPYQAEFGQNSSGGAGGRCALEVTYGGTANFEGVFTTGTTGTSDGILYAFNGTTNAIDCKFYNTRAERRNQQLAFASNADLVNFQNVETSGVNIVDRGALVITNFSNVSTAFASEGYNLGGGATSGVANRYFLVPNFTTEEHSTQDIRINANAGERITGEFRDSNKGNGSSLTIADTVSQNCRLIISATLNIEFLDDTLSPVDATYYAIDNDNGLRQSDFTPFGQPLIACSGDIEYTGTAVSGLATEVIYTGFKGPSNGIALDNRGVNADGDMLFGAIAYNNNIAAFQPSLLGLGEKSTTAILPVDSIITEQDKATAAAYTTQETPYKSYDQLKSVLVDNYAGEKITAVTRSGDTLDARTHDVVIDGTGSGSASFDGTTVTLNASTFIGNITTTGTLTQTNGSTISGLIDVAAGRNNLVTISSLTASNVQIINASNTVLDRQTAVTGTYTFSTAIGVTGPHKIIINREGYAAIVIDVTFAGAAYSFIGALVQTTTPSGSPMYQGTSSGILSIVPALNGSACRAEVGNGTVGAQAIYDESEVAFMTESGMSYLGNGGGACTLASLATGTFLFLQNNFQLKRALAGDSSATVEAFVTSTQGVVLDNVNGDVQFVTVTRAQQLTEYDGFIWVDLIAGVDEFAYPAGTPNRKVDSIANAITLGNFFGINKIKLSGAQTTLSQSIDGYEVFGDVTTTSGSRLIPSLELSVANTANNSVFKDLIVSGATDVSSPVFGNKYIDCVINGLTGLTGVVRSSKLAGVQTVVYDVDLVDCYGTAALNVIGANSSVSMPSFSGQLTIAGMTNAGATVSIGVVSGVVTVDSSCTAGTIIIANADDVENNGNGVTVIEINDSNGGGGGVADWTTAEKEQIRSALGVNGTKTTATGGQLQNKLDASGYTAPDNAGIAAIPTNTLLANDARLNNLNATISSRSTFNSATDQVVASNMRGTDGANTVVPDNASIASILANTNELQQNQGDWTTATGFSTFNPANDTVARVTLVDTTTLNSDMRGTDGALLASDSRLNRLDVNVSTRMATFTYTAPDNTSISNILADTNELQQNQNNWLTATGFSTFNASTDQVTVATNNDKTGYSLANNSITSSTVANNAFNNNTFTTGFYNQIGSEMDDSLSNYDVPSRADLNAGFASVLSAIDALPKTGDITTLLEKLELLEKYHDNTTAYLDATGLIEVAQQDSYFMVVYDNDGTTELKRIAFQDSVGSAALITEATRYVKL